MKYLILAFFMISHAQAYSQYEPHRDSQYNRSNNNSNQQLDQGYRNNGSRNNSDQDATLERRRASTIELLTLANQNRRNRLFPQLQSAISRVTLINEGDSMDCSDQNLAAYVNMENQNVVHICPFFWTFSKEMQVVILLHETSHVMGIGDECQADHNAKTALEAIGARNIPSAYSCW